MILFAQPAFAAMARGLPGRRGRWTVARFPDGEMHVTLGTAVAGRKCAVLAALGPDDGGLLATLLLGHTLAKEGAKSVTLIAPYLGYARHDKAAPRESLATAWMGQVLKASGYRRVVTIDAHSPADKALSPLPIVSLSPAAAFAAVLRKRGWTDATIVAPDHGAVARATALRRAAGVRTPVVVMRKERTRGGKVVSHGLHGAVGERAVIVDDILDTGQTLVACCRLLRAAGARDIVILVTHGVFSGRAWTKLWSLGVRAIHCTDSRPSVRAVTGARVHVVPAAPLLRPEVKP